MLYRLFLDGQLHWQGQDPLQRCREVAILMEQQTSFDSITWDSINIDEDGIITWNFPSSSSDHWYQITDNHGKLTCTCPGFTFRRDCKHLKIYIEKIAK